MKDERKTKAQLIEELIDLRQRFAEISETEPGGKIGGNLQRLKEFHECIVQSISEGIVVEDADGYFTFVNTTAAEMLGYSSGELDGKHWTEIIDPEQQQVVNDAHQRRLQGESSRYEIDLLHKDGSRIPVQVSGSPRFTDGRFDGTLAVFTNISERVVAEQALRKSEERYRQLAERMNDIIWTTDLDLKITYVGPAVEKFHGYSPAEYAQLPIEKRYSEKSFKEVIETYQQGMADLEAGKIEIENFSIIAEREFIAKDGELVFGEESISLLRDQDNNVVGLQGITRDITDRKQSELEHNRLLADFEHRNLLLQTAADVSKSAIGILSPDELIQQTVNLIRERFGYYYVGIFLVDEEGDFAVLRAGTGKAGNQMLGAGHKLAVGGESMIGWSVAHAQARIALDVGEEAVWFDNPYLPETRSEMALPLVVQGEAIGALTVQSEKEAAFGDEDIAVLQTMADQVAIAIQNARLYDTAQREIAERQRAEQLLRVLNRATLAMGKSIEPDEIFAAFAGELKKMGFSCMLFPTDFRQQRLFTKYLGFDNKALKAAEKLIGITYDDYSILVDDAGIIGDVVRNRRAEYIEDVERVLKQWLPKTGKKLIGRILEVLKISRAIIAPMVVEGSPVGVLSVQAEDLTKDDIPAITAFANQVAASWRKAQLFEQAQIEITARKEAERKLRLQAAALEAAANSIVITDREGAILWANPAFFHLTGYMPDEVIGENTRILKSGEQDSSFYENLWDVILSGEVWNGEIANRRKDGRIYTEEMTIAPVVDDSGRITHFIAIKQDITERKQADEKIRLQASALNAAANGIIIVNPDDEIIWANPAMESLSGYSLDEILSATPALFSSGEYDQEFYNEMSDILRDRLVWQGEIINKRKDGSLYFEEQTITPVLNDLGDVTHYISIKRDINARKQAAAEIQRRSQQLAALVEMGQTVASTLELDEVLKQVVNVVPQLVGAEGVSILLLEGQDELVFAAVSEAGEKHRQDGLKGQRMPADVGVAGAVIQTRSSINVKEPGDQEKIYRGLESLSGFYTQSLLAVPLSLGDHIIGVMEAVHSEQGVFSTVDLQMLEATANWASIAIGNARQHENIQRRFQESQTMAIISQALTETLDLEEVLQLIGESAHQVIPAAERTVIHLLDDDKQALWPVVAIGLDELGQPGFNLHIGEGIAGLVISEGTTISVGDTKVDPRYLPLGNSTHLHSLMVAPVLSGQRRLGTISVQSADIDAFSLDDERMLTTLGFHASVAIENARLFETERRRSAELETLRQASIHLTSTLELQPVLEIILTYALQLVSADDVHIFSYDGEQLTFGAALWAGEHQQEPFSEPRSDGLTYNVVRKGERIVIPNMEEHPLFDGQSWQGAILGLPLRFGDEVRGVMNIAFDEPHVFDDNELRILELLADQAAVTLENARLFEAERARRQEAETLRKATSALTLTIEVQEVLDQILIHLEQVVPYDSSACVLSTPGNRWQVVAGRGFPIMDDVIDKYHDAYANEIAQKIVQTAMPLFLDDAQSDPRFEQWGHTDYVRGWMGVPLIVRGEAIGYLTLDSKEVGAYGPSEAALAQAFANQAAVAIENANLYNTTKELAERLMVLHQASQGVTGASTDPENIYITIHKAAAQLMPCEAFSISILDEEAQEIEGVYLIDRDGRSPSLRIPVGAGLSGHIIEHGSPLLIYDVNKTQQLDGVDTVHFGSSDSVRALIGVPMKIGDKIIGSLSAQSYLPHQYTPEDQLLLEMLAAHAAVALDNARLFEDTSMRLREVNTLYQIIRDVVASLDVDEILMQAVNSLQEDFNYYHVHVYLFDDISEMMVVREGSGSVGAQLKKQGHGLSLEQGIIGRVAKTGQTIMSNNVDELEFFFRNPLLPDTSAELTVPLLGRDGIIGVLDIQHQPPYTFDENDIRLVSAVADQLSVALDKAMIYAELQDALHKEQSTRSQLVQAGKLTALGRIVASVAHELNNPLQAIQNALYLVGVENTLSEQAHEDLEVALTETTRMANLISRLRDTYRPTTAEEFHPESLNKLVVEVHKLLATHLRHNDVFFEFLSDPDLPDTLMVGDQMKQVILNLSLNAIETMPGGGQLQVKTGTDEDDILLSVTDTGLGIEDGDLPHIFEPFYTTKEGGTGLGLSVTYDIVQRHGGHIEVESKLGKGSTFKVRLPKMCE